MKLLHNVGEMDKTIRVILGIIFDLVAVFVPLAIGIKILLVLLAAFEISTGLLNFCPVYKILGLNTCKR